MPTILLYKSIPDLFLSTYNCCKSFIIIFSFLFFFRNLLFSIYIIVTFCTIFFYRWEIKTNDVKLTIIVKKNGIWTKSFWRLLFRWFCFGSLERKVCIIQVLTTFVKFKVTLLQQCRLFYWSINLQVMEIFAWKNDTFAFGIFPNTY